MPQYSFTDEELNQLPNSKTYSFSDEEVSKLPDAKTYSFSDEEVSKLPDALMPSQKMNMTKERPKGNKENIFINSLKEIFTLPEKKPVEESLREPTFIESHPLLQQLTYGTKEVGTQLKTGALNLVAGVGKFLRFLDEPREKVLQDLYSQMGDKDKKNATTLLANLGRKIDDFASGKSQELAKNISNTTFADQPLLRAIQVISSNAPQAPLFLTKLGLPILSAVSAGDAYSETLQKTGDTSKAALAGLLTGAWTFLSERIPFEMIAKGKGAVKSGIAEAIQEVGQTGGENIIAKSIYAPEREILTPESLLESAVGGFAMGAPAGYLKQKMQPLKITTDKGELPTQLEGKTVDIEGQKFTIENGELKQQEVADAGEIPSTQGTISKEGQVIESGRRDSGQDIQQPAQEGTTSIRAELGQKELETKKIEHRKLWEEKQDIPLDEKQIKAADNLFDIQNNLKQMNNITQQNIGTQLADFTLYHKDITPLIESGDVKKITDSLNEFYEKNKNNDDIEIKKLAEESKFLYDRFINEGIDNSKMSEVLNGYKNRNNERITGEISQSQGNTQNISTQSISEIGTQKTTSSELIPPPPIPPITTVIESETSKQPEIEAKRKTSALYARATMNLTRKQFDALTPEEKQGLPEYDTISKKEEVEKVSQWVVDNPDEALKVMSGIIPPPNGWFKEAVVVALHNYVKASKDVNIGMKAALTEASLAETRAGQGISILSELDVNSPVKAISEIIQKKKSDMKKQGIDPDAELEKAQKRIEELEKKIKDFEEKSAKVKIEEIIKDEKPQKVEKASYGSKNKIVKQAEYEKTKAELDVRLRNLTVRLDPANLTDLIKIGIYHIEAGGRTFADWSVKMIKDFGDRIKPYLDEIYKGSKKQFDYETKDKIKEKIKKKASKKDEEIEIGGNELGYEIQKIAKQFISEGIIEREALIDAVTNFLNDEVGISISRRDTMDAISGYGKFKQLSKDEIDVKLRDMKGQMQQLAKLEDMAAGKAPVKTGIERRTPSDAEKELIHQVNEAKKKFNIETIDPETELKTALQTLKTRLTNQIKKFEEKLKNLDFAKPEKLNPVLDAEAKKLKSENEAARLAYQKAKMLSDKQTITHEQATKITELSQNIEKTKNAIPENSPNGSKERLEYGTAIITFRDYVNELKTSKKTFLEHFTPNEIAGFTKSIVASLDNSFFGRQGIKTLFTNPDIWMKAFLKSWGDIGRELKGGDAIMPIRIEIISRINALNGKYKAGGYGLEIFQEEEFPSTLPERIPLLGRLFKASQSAYNGAAMRMRADLADRLIKNAEEAGIDTLNKEQAQGLGSLVSSITGRGGIGRLQPLAKELNVLMFSIKFLKSNFDTLTAHQLDSKATPYSKKVAATNLLKIIAGMAGILAIAKMYDDDSVELDPRSTDFAKIKKGNTRFDISGGMASLITLAARIVPTFHNGELGFWSKSSTTGKFSRLNDPGYGKQNVLDVIQSFFEGKLSPIAGFFRDLWKGKDFQGNPITPKSLAANLVTPLSIPTFQDLQKIPKAANTLMSMILTELGVGVSTYSKYNKSDRINAIINSNPTPKEASSFFSWWKESTPSKRQEIVSMAQEKSGESKNQIYARIEELRKLKEKYNIK